jgi:hypothetical protein
MSWHIYDVALRPIDALADVQIRPDPGSVNPFLPGADRTVTNRSYTAFIDLSPTPPAKRQPNTLYAGSGQGGMPNTTGVFIYRIYIRDNGAEPTGGVPLPTVTLESDASRSAPPRSVCDTLQKPSNPLLNDTIASSNGIPQLDGLQPWGYPIPHWRKFVNLPTSLADFALSNPSGERLRPLLNPLAAAGGSGGFLSNIHNAYIATAVNRRYGQVLVTRFKAPTFPNTRPDAPTMASGVQLRYWSMCENEFFSQRFIACATDDQTAVDKQGYVNYVMSTPAQRPARATARCGYTWLPWGPDAEGVLIYRNMLPDASFAQAIQFARYGQETQTMGAYLPTSTYYRDRRAFDASHGGC